MYLINESRCILILILLIPWPSYHDATKLEVRFCGFEQTCSGNMTMQLSEWEFCCRPCECDDICLEKGTCCRDKENIINMESHVNIQQKCLPSAYKPNGTNVNINLISYYTRTNCPKYYKDTNIKVKCENVRPKSITEIRPVSSRDGNIVYKNKYCGYCNGERRTLDWEVSIHKASYPSCRKILESSTLDIDTISSKILSNCILLFIPPTNIKFWKVMCFEDSNVIKQCNVTGKLETIDSELNNFCLNQTDAGYVIFDEMGKVYHNLYCYLCNNLSQGPSTFCLNRLGRHSYSSMYALLNLNKLFSQDSSERKSKRCGKGEILDTFFGKCRPLHCFKGLIPFNGKCVPFLDNDKGFELLLKLVPTHNIKKTDLGENDLQNHYISIQEILGFKKCGLCFVYIFVGKDSSSMFLQEMYFLFAFTPTTRCKIDNILSYFMLVETKLPLVLNLAVHNTVVEYTASRDTGNARALILFPNMKVILQVGTLSSCQSLPTERDRICSKVKLLKHEVKHVMKYHPRRRELLWTKEVNQSAFVCCDKYIGYHKSLSPKLCPCLSVTFIVALWFLDRYLY